MTEEKNTKRKNKEESKIWKNFLYLVDLLIYGTLGNFNIIKNNINLFLGTFLFVFGLLNFQSGKYCDGNTSEYLSCTRPTTYYYYDGLDIAIIIIGLFLIMIWVLKKKRS